MVGCKGAFLDDRNPLADVLSAVTSFHDGDIAIFSVGLPTFNANRLDNVGAIGANFSKAGHANANLVGSGVVTTDQQTGG